MNSRRIISFSILTDAGEATLSYALFEMINGSPVMTPCDAQGNTIFISDAITDLDPDSHKATA